MSRKDYEALAAAIRAAKDVPGDPYRAVVDNLLDALAADNPRFDRERFLAAALGDQ